MSTPQNLPAKSDLTQLIAQLKPAEGYWLTRHDEPISDEVFPTEDAIRDALEVSQDPCNRERDQATDYAPVYVELTIGWTPETGGWSYQTGDNSYSGGAYGHHVWAVAYLTHNSDAGTVAGEILSELGDSFHCNANP